MNNENIIMNKNQPIGVFDSGIGGLSVLKQLIRFLPNENFVYLGDTARVPYGNKSIETVKFYAKQCTEFLIKHEVKLIVTACNTVSSVALEVVKKTAGSKIPVIGMIEPAAEAALRQTNNKTIGIIGTRATINSYAYSNSIETLSDEKIKVFSQACPLFVPIVEEGMIRHPASKMIAEEYLESLKKEKIDSLILGCTHYPLMADLFREIIPGISLIDSGEHSAVTALRKLADLNLLNSESQQFSVKPEISFYVTDLPAMFFELAKKFLGFSVNEPKRIDIM